MSAERAIHERLSSYRPILDLVPIDRILTGWLPTEDTTTLPVDLPFISLTRDGVSQVERTNGNLTIETFIMRMDIYAETLTTGKPIAQRMYDYFNRADFPWSRGRVLDCKLNNYIEERLPQAFWHASQEWKVIATMTGIGA